MTKEEEKAIQDDNKHFMDDYNDKGYMIDAVVVGLIILACGVLFIYEVLNL